MLSKYCNISSGFTLAMLFFLFKKAKKKSIISNFLQNYHLSSMLEFLSTNDSFYEQTPLATNVEKFHKNYRSQYREQAPDIFCLPTNIFSFGLEYSADDGMQYSTIISGFSHAKKDNKQSILNLSNKNNNQNSKTNKIYSI